MSRSVRGLRRIASMPFERLERTDEHSLADPGFLAGNIQHRPHAIGDVDVGVAASQEHRWIAPGEAAKGVARRVALQIGLRLDDPPGEPLAVELMDKRAADQETRQRDRVERKIAPLQPAVF